MNAQQPDEVMMRAAQTVADRLAARAPDVDKTRQIPPETVQELHEAGLLAMAIPQGLGGAGADLVTQTAVFEVIGGACGSTAWCLYNHIGTHSVIHGLMGRPSLPYLRAIVEEGALMAISHLPVGSGRPVPGGYVVNGRWLFVSGSYRARWAFLSAQVPGPAPDWAPKEEEPEPPEIHSRMMAVALDSPGVRIDDTWNAMSLRGSMSNDVVVEEVFVPEDQAPLHQVPDSHEAWPPGIDPASRNKGVIHPLVPAAIHLPALILGIAQAALRDTIEYGKGHAMSLGGQMRGSMPGNQFAIADAAMLIEAGRAFLYQEARTMENRRQAGSRPTPDEVCNLHMAGVVARENAQRALERLFSVRGAHGLYQTGNFERYYRDVRAGTLMAGSAPDLERELVGKHLFGIAPDVKPRWA